MAAPKILVLDDDPSIIYLCEKLLGAAGFDVRSVSSGRETIEICWQEEFDLLILDLKLPDIDGLEVLPRVRQIQPNMAAIIITGYGTMTAAIEAMRLNAQEFILKPFDGNSLVAKVRLVLAHRQESLGVIRGDLNNMSLTSIVSINCNEGNRAHLVIRRNGQRADIFFDGGNIVHMALDDLEGEEVIYEVLTWENGAFELRQDVPPPKRTVHAAWSGLLLDGLHRIDEGSPSRDSESEDRFGQHVFTLDSEVSEQLAQRLDQLLAEVEGRCILMTDRGGRLIHWRGWIDKGRAISLAALVAGSFSATAEIANALRKEGEPRQFRQSLQESEDFSIYSVAVGERLILSVSFEHGVPLGFVRVSTLKAVGEIQEMLAEDSGGEMGALFDEGLRQEVGDALDALFGDGDVY